MALPGRAWERTAGGGGGVGLADQPRQPATEQTAEVYRRVAEASADVLLLYSADGTLEWASPSLMWVFGWRPEEVVGTPFHLGSEEEGADSWRRWESSFATSWTQRRRIRRGDGARAWVEEAVSVSRDEAGRVLYAVVSARDVTAHVHAQNALTESEEHFRLLAEYAADIAFRTDTEWRLTWVPDAVRECLGWRPEQLLHKPLERWVHPDDTAEFHERGQLVAQGRAQRFDVRLRAANGRWRWFDLQAHPVHGPDGRVTGFAGGVHDVTHRVVGSQG